MNRLIMIMMLAICSTTIFSQTTNEPSKTKKEHAVKTNYICPMHSDVTSTAPGDCSKCGTKLVVERRSSKHAEQVAYSCPIHPDMVSVKSGKCPKCGMKLGEKKAEKSKS